MRLDGEPPLAAAQPCFDALDSLDITAVGSGMQVTDFRAPQIVARSLWITLRLLREAWPRLPALFRPVMHALVILG